MKGFFDLIEQVDLESAIAYERILEIFFARRFGLPGHIVPIKNGSKIYRTRFSINEQAYESIADISYPLCSNVKNFSRANRPGQIVFYGSDSINTNLTELMPYWLENIQIGQKIYVTHGEWKVVEDIRVLIIPDYSNSKMVQLTEKINQLIGSEEEKMLIDYINKLFRINTIENKNIYKITSAFCNVIRCFAERKNESIDGIMYTSVQDRIGFNLALNTNVVDSNKIQLAKVGKQSFKKINNKPLYIEINNITMASHVDHVNGRILW